MRVIRPAESAAAEHRRSLLMAVAMLAVALVAAGLVALDPVESGRAAPIAAVAAALGLGVGHRANPAARRRAFDPLRRGRAASG